MIDREEVDWWCKEYPELTREEVADILEAVEEQINNKKGNP